MEKDGRILFGGSALIAVAMFELGGIAGVITLCVLLRFAEGKEIQSGCGIPIGHLSDRVGRELKRVPALFYPYRR